MEALNNEWAIAIVGGIISTVAGTLISNALQNNRTGNRRKISLSIGDLLNGVDGLYMLGVLAFIVLIESIWLFLCITVLYVGMADVFGDGFGSVVVFFSWLTLALAIPRITIENITKQH